MSVINEEEFNKAIFSSYKKKYEELIASWFSKDALGNIEIHLPEYLDENTSPAETLQAIKEIVAHESFIYSVNDVIKYSRVTMDVIREYAEYVDWEIVATKQVLDERFIEEFINELDIQQVLLYQDTSDEFIKKYVKKAKIKIKSKINKIIEIKDVKHLIDDLDMNNLNINPLNINPNSIFGGANNVFTTYGGSVINSVSNLNEEQSKSLDSESAKELLNNYFNLPEANKSALIRSKLFKTK